MKGRLFSRSVIFGLIALAVCWLVFRYFRGLYRLGEMDAAIGSMRAIANNEDAFAKSHANLGYSCNLDDVSKDTAIVGEQRNGYVFEITDCRSSRSGGPTTTYHATARPPDRGLPAYCVDQSRVLRAEDGGSVAGCLKYGHAL